MNWSTCLSFLGGLQELVEERDNLEKQLSQVTSLLGQVEEKRLSTMKDMENMKVQLCNYSCRHI